MTIALGILASDGVVLAADTLETYPGSIKTRAPKIIGAVNDGQGAMVVAGAGSAIYVDSLAQQVCDGFSRKTPETIAELGDNLRSAIRDFHAESVAPYGGWPEYERPACSLLIAAELGDEKRELWVSEKSAMRSCPHAAIGIGGSFASLLLGRLLRPGITLRQAALLAAYAVYETKRSVDGCGGDTQMVVLYDGTGAVWETSRMEMLEKQLAGLSQLEDRLLLYSIGLGSRRERDLRKLPSKFEGFRDEILGLQDVEVSESPEAQRRSSVPRYFHEGHPLHEAFKRKRRRKPARP